MANYVLIYQAPGGAAMGATPDEQATTDAGLERLVRQAQRRARRRRQPGDKTRTISADGSVRDEANGPTGYSIIKADSLDEAVRLAKGCPVLQGPGNSVQVVETIAM